MNRQRRIRSLYSREKVSGATRGTMVAVRVNKRSGRSPRLARPRQRPTAFPPPAPCLFPSSSPPPLDASAVSTRICTHHETLETARLHDLAQIRPTQLARRSADPWLRHLSPITSNAYDESRGDKIHLWRHFLTHAMRMSAGIATDLIASEGRG